MTLISFIAISAYLILIVGEVSFGQQAFFGIGAYMTATSTALLGLDIVVALCLAFIVSAFSQDVEDAIHASGLYFLFGAFNAAGIVFVLLFCPETKGKTPEDMKKYFSGVKQ